MGVYSKLVIDPRGLLTGLVTSFTSEKCLHLKDFLALTIDIGGSDEFQTGQSRTAQSSKSQLGLTTKTKAEIVWSEPASAARSRQSAAAGAGAVGQAWRRIGGQSTHAIAADVAAMSGFRVGRVARWSDP